MHPNTGTRRRHSDELKAKVLVACDEPGASISGVALAHGLNANLLHKWRSGRGVKRVGMAKTLTVASAALSAQAVPTEFVAIEMPALPAAAALAASAPSGDPPIQIELRRGPLQLNVRWPTSAARDCATWLHELSCGLLK